MGKIRVQLDGAREDIERIYEHLRYHVKKLSKIKGATDNHIEFDITV